MSSSHRSLSTHSWYNPYNKPVLYLLLPTIHKQFLKDKMFSFQHHPSVSQIYVNIPSLHFQNAQKLSRIDLCLFYLPLQNCQRPRTPSLSYTRGSSSYFSLHFYTDVSSFLSGSHIRALHHQYSSSPSSSCSLMITWSLQILSVFSHSFFSSTQMIAKHPLPADSPNSLTVQMSQTSNTEQILHSQIQDITKLKSPSLLWYTYTVKAKLSLGSSSSKKTLP